MRRPFIQMVILSCGVNGAVLGQRPLEQNMPTAKYQKELMRHDHPRRTLTGWHRFRSVPRDQMDI